MSGPVLEWDEDEDQRWLFIGGAPLLDGPSATAVVELLWAMADTIDSTYAAEIIAHRQRGSSLTPFSLADVDERQLRLDLGDDDF